MLSGEPERANTLVLAWRMMISAFSAILTWMEEAFVLVDALPTGYFETSRTSTRLHQEIVQEQIIITCTETINMK